MPSRRFSARAIERRRIHPAAAGAEARPANCNRRGGKISVELKTGFVGGEDRHKSEKTSGSRQLGKFCVGEAAKTLFSNCFFFVLMHASESQLFYQCELSVMTEGLLGTS